MTPVTKPTPNDVEIDKEVLVTDGPSDVADNPVNPQEQTDNPLANP